MKKFFALFVMTALCALALLPSTGRGQKTDGNGPRHEAASVPGELLVQFKAGATIAEKGRALGRINAEVLENITSVAARADGRGDLVLARYQPDTPAAAARRAIQEDPAVEFVEPNWVYTHQAISNDTYYTNGNLWGMYGDQTSPANQFGSQAGEAWATGHTGSSSVYVGIIDEGIQYTSPDLDANIWSNPFDPVDGVDNDGNGYADDTHGWDFAGNNNTIYDGGSSGNADDHGTHVAGTIGAEGGNGIGVAGVNWQVTMISGKFLGRNGGTTANAIKAVDYFTDLKVRHGLNIVATNNSWGGGGFSQALLDAIVRGARQNILFIAAAGNGGSDGVGDNNDTTASYPSNYNTTAGAGYDAVIAVMSITNTGARSSFSNYGVTTVDIGAPGSGIWSTTAFNTLSSFSGTSMATPHVTGGAALYASTHPGATAAQIRDAILSSAVPTASLSGRCVTGGRLNVSGF
ncbi:MAG: S8 family serine peptidase [Acidobacteria bacterium]|nr:S8 family serine peptidase [Acidobacteriota bacterium]MCA1618642.1 S8 family serine peptidase [Acidobacteriota bacterium]